jgi:hypothetical protein
VHGWNGYARYANRPDGGRCPRCSRSAFQIWPQSVHRQYVETLSALLVVVTLSEVQKGQAFGATGASEGWVYTRLTSQCCGSFFSAEPLLCHPVTADGPEVDTLIGSNPGCRERGNRDGDADAQGDPGSIHERPVTAIAISLAPLDGSPPASGSQRRCRGHRAAGRGNNTTQSTLDNTCRPDCPKMNTSAGFDGMKTASRKGVTPTSTTTSGRASKDLVQTARAGITEHLGA